MKEVISYLEVDNFKNNKPYLVARIIYSLLIALSFFLNSLLVFGTEARQTYKDVYFQEIKPSNVLVLIITFVIVFFIISALGNIYEYIEEKKQEKRGIDEKLNSKKVFIISFVTILICWLPTILSYVPGGLFDDAVNTLFAARGQDSLSNNQSVLYMYIMKIFVYIGENFFGDVNIGLAIYSFTQTIIFISVLSTIITWLYKRGIDKKGIALLIAFVSLFKLFPIYGTAIWKDSLFAIGVTFLTYLVCKIWYSDGEELKNPKMIREYIIISLLISFLRNNGQYITVGTTIVLGLCYWKKINRSILKFLIPVFIEVIIVGIIQVPVRAAYNRQIEFRESVGIPIQQICHVIANDGNVSKEQLEFINNIVSIDTIKTTYYPYNVDMIKYNNFNDDYLDNNKKEFIKVWGEIGLKNPKMYIKAYLLSTTGYWNLIRTSHDWRFIKNYYYLESYPKMVLKWLWQKDLIEEATGISLRKYVNPEIVIPCAMCEAVLLLSIVYVIKNKRYSNIIMFVPVLIMLATILIATPIAFSMRYIFGLVIIMPFSLLFPIIEKESKEKERLENTSKKE